MSMGDLELPDNLEADEDPAEVTHPANRARARFFFRDYDWLTRVAWRVGTDPRTLGARA